jgi:hypothetical protein
LVERHTIDLFIKAGNKADFKCGYNVCIVVRPSLKKIIKVEDHN